LNTLQANPQASSDVQDRIWDTYLTGLLSYSYTANETVATPRVDVQIEDRPAPEPVSIPVVPTTEIAQVPPPLWSTESFQCMFFSIGRMLLAAPLITLREVVRYDYRQLRNLPGQALYSKGIMDHRGEMIQLIDPGHLLMGDRYEPVDRRYRYIILGDRAGIGYLCHEFVDMCKLNPDSVSWYPNRIKRPWLAGIYRERLCTVIDIDKLLPQAFLLSLNDQQEKTL
jgi:chemotaxis signal transduction protein